MRRNRLSRREFLERNLHAVGVATSAGLLPLVAGCGKPAAPAPLARVVDGPIVLTAAKFPGAPDGVEREIWGFNKQFPGPVIRVKEGDILRARLVNELGVPTSIHWHGMHQPGTWRMDGVEDVSRPPVPKGESFTYEFKATPAGTHWYHSHTGVQYGDGLYGPLIVEEATPIAKYDRDEIVIINDWFHQPGDVLLEKVMKGAMEMPAKDGKKDMKDMRDTKDMKGMKDVGDVPFQSALINGKGRRPGDRKSPLTVIEVKKGETVRLRLICASSTYAFRFQIDEHPLTVIASDGPALKPVTVDNLVMTLGERYDVLLKADREGVYWIRAVTLDGNETRAILKYSGSAAAEPEERAAEWGSKMLMPDQLRAPEPMKLEEKPREIVLKLGGSMKPYRWSINEQYFPKAEPIAVEKDESIRFVLHNPTMMDHPFHLHGHSFRVLGKPEAMNLTDPPLKDTVAVPAKSALALQFVANNPGRWFFHCHIEWHLAAGMARVVEVRPFSID